MKSAGQGYVCVAELVQYRSGCCDTRGTQNVGDAIAAVASDADCRKVRRETLWEEDIVPPLSHRQRNAADHRLRK